MQDYYEQNYFQDVPNVAVILSFVGTLASIFFYGAGPLAQVFASIVGFRITLFTGTIMITLCLTMAGFSTQVRCYNKEIFSIS
jgi:Na+/pantothenate symporter